MVTLPSSGQPFTVVLEKGKWGGGMGVGGRRERETERREKVVAKACFASYTFQHNNLAQVVSP